MRTAFLSLHAAGFVALATTLFLGTLHAESRPPLDKSVKRCILIVKCKVEIKDGIIKYRVVESWKGNYRPDLFYHEPPEGYLYPRGQDIKASRISNLKDGQEVIFFYSDNAISAVKKGKIFNDSHDDSFPVVNGKVVYGLNSRFETIGDREVYTLEEFKKAILAIVEDDVKQKANKDLLKLWQDAPIPKELAAVPVPAKTPFDGDELKRAWYFSSFRRGYGWARDIHFQCPPNPDANNLDFIRGWVEGWQAGVKAGGQGSLPAKYAAYLIWRDDGKR